MKEPGRGAIDGARATPEADAVLDEAIQPADPNEDPARPQPAAAIVRGDLRAMSLPSIIQSNCSDRNTARLLLRRADQEGLLFFADGGVVHAQLETLVGEQAVFELLRWMDGSFELEMGTPAPERTIWMDGTALVLEGLRRLDEGETVEQSQTEPIEVEVGHDAAEPDAHAGVLKRLRAKAGLERAVICSREGEVLGEAGAAGQQDELHLAAFLGYRAEVLGRMLRAGPLHQIILSRDSGVTLIVPDEQDYIVLTAAPRASGDGLAGKVREMLSRS